MVMETPLVSIVVPVYDTSEYLRQCLESIVVQTYHNIEVILIDDGSTDGSGAICDEYAWRDIRFHVIHKNNEGLSSARNIGTERAQGEYVLYVDSDDYIERGYVKDLLETALENNADIVQCLMEKFWEDGRRISRKRISTDIEIYSSAQALEELCYQRKFMQYAWGKLYRKELLDGAAFPVGVIYEDMAVMYRIFGNAGRILLLPKVMYHYRQHGNSIMHMAFSDKKIDRIRVTGQMKEYMADHYPQNRKAMDCRWLLSNLQLLMEMPFGTHYKNIRKEVYGNIKGVRKSVITDAKAKAGIRIMAISSYGGCFLLMCLGRAYKKILR